MDNLAELLKNIDRSKIDEALALLQSLKNDQPPATPEQAPAPASPEARPPTETATPVESDSSPLTAEKTISSELAKASADTVNEHSSDDDDTPLSTLGQLLTPDEQRSAREARRAAREAEREARRKMKEEETAFLKAEADARKTLVDAEREDRRVLRESERDMRKAKRDAEREARRKAREEELEAEKEQRQKARDAELEAKQKARQAELEARQKAKEAELEAKQKAKEAEKEALKAPKEAPNSLAIFGFLSNTVKTDAQKNKLFSAFVQDKRIVPAALQFWAKPEEPAVANEEEASVVNIPSATGRGSMRRDPEGSSSRFAVDEESSLLHPPICVEPAPAHKVEVCVRDFNAMIEESNRQQRQPRELLRECGCPFHVATPDPYARFDNEAVFSGFFAIGYDPCQSRPPYFGTYNHLQEGNLNEVELLQMARFPPGREIPRLSNIDYEYDSGDDWDVLEGDEDIAASSSGDSDEDSDLNSLDSSDLDFINDDDDDDSDCDIQRRVVEARQRRLHRLRNKDKLVPSYSGPFVGIPNDEHPLRNYDEMERNVPLTSAYFAALLESELNALTSGSGGIPAADDNDLSHEERDAKRQRALMEAALKNRREMTEHELKVLHDLVRANGKISTKMILTALKEQQLCVGVAQAEVVRTIKRFFERRRGTLVPRDVPWSATDERLFAPAASTKKSRGNDKDGADKHNGDDDEEAEDGADNEEGTEKAESPLPSSAETPLPQSVPSVDAEEAGHPPASTRSSAEVREEGSHKGKQMTLMDLLPKVAAGREAKRPRENEQPEDQNGGVSSSTGQ